MQQKRIGNDDCFKICVKITLIKKVTQKLLGFWVVQIQVQAKQTCHRCYFHSTTNFPGRCRGTTIFISFFYAALITFWNLKLINQQTPFVILLFLYLTRFAQNFARIFFPISSSRSLVFNERLDVFSTFRRPRTFF